MRHMSLCTGYGGIDLALEAVWGAETVAVAATAHAFRTDLLTEVAA